MGQLVASGKDMNGQTQSAVMQSKSPDEQPLVIAGLKRKRIFQKEDDDDDSD